MIFLKFADERTFHLRLVSMVWKDAGVNMNLKSASDFTNCIDYVFNVI